MGLDAQRMFSDFLENFVSPTDGASSDGAAAASDQAHDYVRVLNEMVEMERTTLYVNFEHLMQCAPPPAASCARPRALRASLRARLWAPTKINKGSMTSSTK